MISHLSAKNEEERIKSSSSQNFFIIVLSKGLYDSNMLPVIQLIIWLLSNPIEKEQLAARRVSTLTFLPFSHAQL